MSEAENYLDEKFPKEVYYKGIKKPESQLRGEALVLFAISKSDERNRILKIIDKRINDLNKKENYSLFGDKKFCCQAELILLKEDAVLLQGDEK